MDIPDRELMYRLFEGLPRQGPGLAACTEQAYTMLAPLLPCRPHILDIGCGMGASMLTLARMSGGVVHVLDNHEPFLRELTARATAEGLSGHIMPVVGSMDALPFPEGTFDLIWSEGAAYIMGFTDGLRARVAHLREEWAKNPRAAPLLDITEAEITLFEHYADVYGYVLSLLERE
jgi:SAM-dependent methyltransferase